MAQKTNKQKTLTLCHHFKFSEVLKYSCTGRGFCRRRINTAMASITSEFPV